MKSRAASSSNENKMRSCYSISCHFNSFKYLFRMAINLLIFFHHYNHNFLNYYIIFLLFRQIYSRQYRYVCSYSKKQLLWSLSVTKLYTLHFQHFFPLISSLIYSRILHMSSSLLRLHYIKKFSISVVTWFTKEPP